MRYKSVYRNHYGLTLLETLVAIIIFILASIFIVTLTASAIDKPKTAEVVNDFSTYEKVASLLLKEVTDNPTLELLSSEFNLDLPRGLKFLEGVSEKETAYNKKYSLTIGKDGSQTEIIITTGGKKDTDLFKLVVVEDNGVVDYCTKGFGRNSKKLTLLVSDSCTTIEGEVTPPTSEPEINPEPELEHITEIPVGYIGIYNDVDLNNVRKNLKANYIVMNDIDLSTSPFNTDTDGWEPLGIGSSQLYQGVFEGNNYTISNLRINKPDPYSNLELGLFDNTGQATIQNLILTNVDITANGYAGAVAGTSDGSDFKNIKVTGSLKNTESIMMAMSGGVVGALENGTLDSIEVNIIANTPKPTDTNHMPVLGGVAGSVMYATVSNVKATLVSTSDIFVGFTGGVLGHAMNSELRDSQATITMEGGGYLGGQVGYTHNLTASNLTSQGTIRGKAGNLGSLTLGEGGLFGSALRLTLTNSESSATIEGFYQSGGIVGEMQAGELINVSSSSNVTGSGNLGGVAGTADDTSITGVNSSGSIKLTHDTGNVGGVIGHYKNVYTQYPTAENVKSTASVEGKGNVGGLFGLVDRLIVIKDVEYNGNVKATGQYSFVGGLVGELSGTLDNTKSSGAVTNLYSGNATGGLVGKTKNISIVKNSSSTSTVKGRAVLGGLIGEHDGSVVNSHASGNVEGTTILGGLIGGATQASSIEKSYATGSVTGVGEIGGLVGNLGVQTVLKNSYATGDLSVNSGFVGGLVGFESDRVTIENTYSTGKIKQANPNTTSPHGGLNGSGLATNVVSSYYNKDTAGITRVTDGIPKTTQEMKQKSTFIGWDFNTIWQIEEGISYPTLR